MSIYRAQKFVLPNLFWLCLAILFFAQKQANSSALQDALQKTYQAPEISGIDNWLNSKPLTLASLKGKVVLIDFWTYSCINCLRTLPHVNNWHQQYHDKGLVIIGIHSPEFSFEKNIKNVESAVKKYGINYAVALDNELETWTSFQNKYWPAHYLIDQKGHVVYTHFGEGNYAQTENNIRHLLGLNALKTKGAEPVTSSSKQTPETYLDSQFERFLGPKKLSKNIANFSLPKNLPINHWALEKKWLVESQRIVAQESGAKLQLNFTAKKVFLVLGSSHKKPLKIKLKINGKSPKKDEIMVSEHRLYQLFEQDKIANGLLEIISSEAGLEAYAFTFES
jgi:thiol-disulfide isomerase/thioredoxin